MSLMVSPDCLRLGLRAGAILFREVHITTASPAQRSETVRAAQAIRERFPSPAAIRSAPEVIRFHNLLRKVGVNPRREQPSLERLLHFALKRGDLPAVNNLVDAYNLVSVRTSCSLGAHDLDQIALPVALRLLTGAESFTPLGAEAEVAVRQGEYGYVDARGRVLCRLDLLQAEFSKVTARTKNALLIIEGTSDHPAEVLRQAFAEVLDLVKCHCGGAAEIAALLFPE
jgi:DNA/RNA-binding domain of Phe-tRNA-synthetase-like protein